MKALVGAFNQEKALVGAFSVIVKTGCRTDGALHSTTPVLHHEPAQPQPRAHEGPVDGEVEDESDACRPSVGQGSWSHSALLWR